MKVIEPGHVYSLQTLDDPENGMLLLVFVRRVGDKYPGNPPPSHGGTTVQEVLRACIDRLNYVNNQQPSTYTLEAKEHLEEAFWLLERRAAARAGRKFNQYLPEILNEPTCSKCGHVQCKGECRP